MLNPYLIDWLAVSFLCNIGLSLVSKQPLRPPLHSLYSLYSRKLCDNSLSRNMEHQLYFRGTRMLPWVPTLSREYSVLEVERGLA